MSNDGSGLSVDSSMGCSVKQSFLTVTSMDLWLLKCARGQPMDPIDGPSFHRRTVDCARRPVLQLCTFTCLLLKILFFFFCLCSMITSWYLYIPGDGTSPLQHPSVILASPMMSEISNMFP